MSGKLLVLCFMLFGMVLAIQSCQGGNTELASTGLSERALAGKQIFISHECNQCHYVGDEEVVSDAPDLLDPFLANDSLFVRTHLRFVETSKMPAPDLSDEEIRAVSHYVAEMHRAQYPVVAPDEADVVCAVCYAPVKSADAKKAGLEVIFLKNRFYFECEKCLKTFQTAPHAFMELLKQYEHEQAELLSNK